MWHADRDVSGMCCPVELRSVLADSFKRTDEELLQWLRSTSCLCLGSFSWAVHAHSLLNEQVVHWMIL